MCTPTADACTSTVLDITSNVLQTAAEIGVGAVTGEADIMSIVNGVGSTAQSLAMGLCPEQASLI